MIPTTQEVPRIWTEDSLNIKPERELTTPNLASVELVYFEEYNRIDEAFYREKQIQNWSRAKKEALINGELSLLKKSAECQNDSHYKNKPLGDRAEPRA